jgi:type IV pilus assembly protein PilB
MSELAVSEDELRELFVTRLELLPAAVFDDVMATAKRLRIPAERALAERARVPPTFLLEQLAEFWNVGFTELRISEVKPAALRLVREDLAASRLVAAFEEDGSSLKVAMANPRDTKLLADLRRMTMMPIIPLLAPTRAIRKAHLLYGLWLREALQQTASGAAIPVSKPAGRELNAVELVNHVLEYAIVSGASDIHVEPYEWEGLIRYRVDGVLNEVFSLLPESYPTLVARIKVLSGMRVDDKRAPQDGRFGLTLGGADIDLRVSSTPTHWGEKVVMRVLSKEPAAIDLEALGLTPDDYQIMLKSIQRPFGMVLVTGPTGSGKTTTLYATLARLSVERQGRLNISTIEDPVEQPVPRVSQIAVNPAAGIDFVTGLRSLLRQDPDVIMVGEIRDRETAEIAVRAALVGRLLFSTLHTNDAAGAVARLIDMGIEPFLLSSTLELVVAQRLARRICMTCRESSGDAPAFKALQATPAFAAAVPVLQRRGVLSAAGDPLARVRLFRGRGCARCSGTGYRGRVGLFELLHVNEEMRALIVGGRYDAMTIRASAVAHGMKTMFEDALAKAFLGETTIEEAVRATA